MAGSKGDFLSNKILNQIFNATAYTFPSSVDFALFTVNPTHSGGGTEVTGGSYGRIQVTCNTTNFPVTTTETTQNATAIAFGTASAGWGTVTGVAIYEHGNNNLLYWGPLTASRTVLTGDTFTIPINGATITEG